MDEQTGGTVSGCCILHIIVSLAIGIPSIWMGFQLQPNDSCTDVFPVAFWFVASGVIFIVSLFMVHSIPCASNDECGNRTVFRYIRFRARIFIAIMITFNVLYFAMIVYGFALFSLENCFTTGGSGYFLDMGPIALSIFVFIGFAILMADNIGMTCCIYQRLNRI